MACSANGSGFFRSVSLLIILAHEFSTVLSIPDPLIFCSTPETGFMMPSNALRVLSDISGPDPLVPTKYSTSLVHEYTCGIKKGCLSLIYTTTPSRACPGTAPWLRRPDGRVRFPSTQGDSPEASDALALPPQPRKAPHSTVADSALY